MKVVVLGGYGNFGARICPALAGDETIALVVAGRDGDRAARLAAECGGASAAIDAGAPGLAARLREAGAGLVVHTAGPFQAQAYQVARAAAEAGSHYIDLADGRRFVCDFAAALDPVFRGAGLCAVTGASTVPALSSAVVDALQPRFARLEAIDFCIAPAQQAPRGEATVAGVLSYCGVPVQVWQDGRWQARRGWSAPVPVRFARMKPRRGALCDIPDLELFPARYAGVQGVMFRAALEVGAAQAGFALLARLRTWGLPVATASMARWLHRAGHVFDRFGTPTGGMVVRVRGPAAEGGAPLQLAWHLTAGDHHGPEVPCMAAIVLARRLARGERWASGAQPCTGLLTLVEFAPEFDRWRMVTEVLQEPVDGA
jgi:hypothetical protein